MKTLAIRQPWVSLIAEGYHLPSLHDFPFRGRNYLFNNL